MKFYIAMLVGLLFVSASAFGALSIEDYEKLNTMFKESDARTQQAINESEARMKDHVSQEIAKVNTEIRRVDSRIDETNKRMDTGFQAVNAQFGAMNNRFGDINTRLNFNFGLLVVLIGAVIGLPLLRERKKDREQDEQLAAQQALLKKQQVLIEKQQEQLAAQQQKLDAQQQLLAAQQQEMAAVREELATLKQQVPRPSTTE